MATLLALKRPPLPTTGELGARLRELREREHLTVHDIARRAKMSDQDVTRFEDNGEIDGNQLIHLIGMISADRSLDHAFIDFAGWEPEQGELIEVLEAWSAGKIGNREAIKLARLNDYADLVATTLKNDVPLPARITEGDLEDYTAFIAMALKD